MTDKEYADQLGMLWLGACVTVLIAAIGVPLWATLILVLAYCVYEMPASRSGADYPRGDGGAND